MRDHVNEASEANATLYGFQISQDEVRVLAIRQQREIGFVPGRA